MVLHGYRLTATEQLGNLIDALSGHFGCDGCGLRLEEWGGGMDGGLSSHSIAHNLGVCKDDLHKNGLLVAAKLQ